MSDFITALAAQDQPQAVFRALEQRMQAVAGLRLFTLMEIDRARGVARRSYSNMPDAYPTSGEKPMPANAWSDQVEGRHETFVANTLDEIAAVFPDHALIASLGCESCVNVPVVVGGQVLGTLNCLHEARYYTPARVAAAESLRLPAAVAFLLSARIRDGAARPVAR